MLNNKFFSENVSNRKSNSKPIELFYEFYVNEKWVTPKIWSLIDMIHTTESNFKNKSLFETNYF